MQTQTSAALRPPAPPPRDDRATERLAAAFLVQLSRAVQRASMYPPGHPAAGAGLAPFAAAVRPLLSKGPVSVAVGRTRLFVAIGREAPTEHESPWLAGRLFDNMVATLTIQTDFDAAEAATLVDWLAQPLAEEEAALPELTTVRLARFDGHQLRFKETAASVEVAPPAAHVAWHALTTSLADMFGLPFDARNAGDPVALAQQIRQAIHSQEGTGISELADHLVRFHEQARDADPETRASLLGWLAALVTELHPELKGSLLSVSTADPEAKVRTVADILDRLPTTVLSDIVANLQLEQHDVPASFGRFIKSLSRLAAADPALGQSVEDRFGAAGLPVALFDDALPVQAPEPSAGDLGALAVPDDYRETLDHLSATGEAKPAAPLVETRDMEPAEVDRHVARIARLEAVREDLGDDLHVYLTYLTALAPRQLAEGDLQALAETADLVLRLLGSGAAASAANAAALDAFRQFCGQRSTVDAVVRDLATGAFATSQALGSAVLLSAGGPAAAQAALDWLPNATDASSRARVTQALVHLDAEVFREVVLPRLSSQLRLAEAVLAIINDVEPSRATEAAIGIAAHPDLDLRLRAVKWLLGTPLTSGKRIQVLKRAIDDNDARIVEVGVEHASLDDHPGAAEALVGFISRRVGAALTPLQIRAVGGLDVNRDDVVVRLGHLLATRRTALGPRSLRVSVRVARALSRSSATAGRAAARAWWFSLAGLVSVLSGAGSERR